jgi:selenide,water dikinase
LNDWVRYEESISKEEQLLLCDAQTSGGLLAAVAPIHADKVLDSLRARGIAAAARVGQLEAGEPGKITVARV